jgi:rhodanese-related sulfurtransferase
MKNISTEELQSKLEQGPQALFDVRGDVDFEQAHIPGAKTAPMGSLSFRVAHTMNPESMVIVYADGGEDDIAAEAAERLESLGMRNVHRYADGLAAWRRAGLPIEQSPSAKTHTHGPVREVRPLVVDRENAYGGAFKGEPPEGGGGG